MGISYLDNHGSYWLEIAQQLGTPAAIQALSECPLWFTSSRLVCLTCLNYITTRVHFTISNHPTPRCSNKKLLFAVGWYLILRVPGMFIFFMLCWKIISLTCLFDLSALHDLSVWLVCPTWLVCLTCLPYVTLQPIRPIPQSTVILDLINCRLRCAPLNWPVLPECC